MFSAYVVLLPIIQYYKSPVSVLNMATFLALIWLIIFAIRSEGKLVIVKPFAPITLFPIWVTGSILVFGLTNKDPSMHVNIWSYLRLMMLLISLIYLGSKYFDIDYALSFMEKLLLASSFYIVIQLLVRLIFRFNLMGVIPTLVTYEGYKNSSMRASGFFMESAAFAQSAILYLCYKLFSEQSWTKNDQLKLIIVIVGIVLSGSGQGYVLLLFLFLSFFLYRFFTNASIRKIVEGIIVIILIILALYILFQTPYGQFAISRLYTTKNGDISFGGQGLAGRTYTNRYFYSLTDTQKVWGIGFGNISEITAGYINSLYYYLIEGGYISIAMFAIILISAFVYGNTRVRMYCMIYAIMFYFTGCGRGVILCYSLLFLFWGNEKLINTQTNDICAQSQTEGRALSNSSG